MTGTPWTSGNRTGALVSGGPHGAAINSPSRSRSDGCATAKLEIAQIWGAGITVSLEGDLGTLGHRRRSTAQQRSPSRLGQFKRCVTKGLIRARSGNRFARFPGTRIMAPQTPLASPMCSPHAVVWPTATARGRHWRVVSGDARVASRRRSI
jgi:hypothetical protein